jgi:hypothetical protein
MGASLAQAGRLRLPVTELLASSRRGRDSMVRPVLETSGRLTRHCAYQSAATVSDTRTYPRVFPRGISAVGP